MSLALLAVLLASGPDRFGAAFDAADRLAVVQHDFVTAPDGRSSTQIERNLYDSSSAGDVEALRDALRATPEEGICACMASTEIHLYRGNERLATVYYLGERIKGDLWAGDVRLVSHEALLRWFDARGVSGPRTEALAEEERDRAVALLEARWLAAMPPVLRPLWNAQRERIRQDPVFEPSPAWRGALASACPEPVDRAVALLRWYGYGGPWTGYLSQESITETLLREVPFATVLVAIEQEASDGAVLEGAARLVSAHDFGDARAAVPPHFRILLLEHVREGGDADKRERAEKALGDRR